MGTVFTVTFALDGGFRFTLDFNWPPYRQEIERVVKAVWRKRTRREQDAMWHMILIVDFLPEGPWLGEVETWYGTVTCETIFANERNARGQAEC